MNNPAKLLGRLLLSFALFALATPALAGAADGEGLWGRASDFDITMWGFGVILLFMILPAVLSYIQHRLDTKKEREREQLERVRKP